MYYNSIEQIIIQRQVGHLIYFKGRVAHRKEETEKEREKHGPYTGLFPKWSLRTAWANLKPEA